MKVSEEMLALWWHCSAIACPTCNEVWCAVPQWQEGTDELKDHGPRGDWIEKHKDCKGSDV